MKNLEKDKNRLNNDKLLVEDQLQTKQIELKQCKQVGMREYKLQIQPKSIILKIVWPATAQSKDEINEFEMLARGSSLQCNAVCFSLISLAIDSAASCSYGLLGHGLLGLIPQVLEF